MLTIACVHVGHKYSTDYVDKLYNMVSRHLPVPFNFICYSDQGGYQKGIQVVDVSPIKLTGWWMKMILFDPVLRGDSDCIYFDLDTVIMDDISPLLDFEAEFSICQNFTRLAGNANWPCNYGSCVMAFKKGFGEDIWEAFRANHTSIISRNPKGDQQAIESLYPSARYIQSYVPKKFFLGYRDLIYHQNEKPKDSSVLIFAGKNKPATTPLRWVKREWQ